jgi:hypothetical protein
MPLFRRTASSAALVLTGLVFLPMVSTAEEGRRAEESIQKANLDTTYGRIDGDVGFVMGVGATFGPSTPRGVVDLRLRYLDTAGIFGFYEDGFGGSDPRRAFGGGVEIRPLFLSRWLEGDELSSAWFDLLIDSLGLELGAFFDEPLGTGFSTRPGLQASLGVEVPVLGRATGPWIGLHGGIRWTDAALQGQNPAMGPPSRSGFLAVTIAYHRIFSAHLVDANDVAPR